MDTWNRSSALDPESLGRINSAIAQGVDALTGAVAKHAAHLEPKIVVTLSNAQVERIGEIIREAVSTTIEKSLVDSGLL